MSLYKDLEDAIITELEQGADSGSFVAPPVLHLEPAHFDELKKELVITNTNKKLPQQSKRFSIRVLDFDIEIRSDDYSKPETIH